MKRILVGFLAVLMLFTAACGVQPIESTAPSEQSGSSFFLGDDEAIEVVTPYCVLKYPIKWSDSVVTKVNEGEGLYSVSYSAKLSEVQVPLFTIDIGEGSQGFELGTIETKDGVKTVYMLDRSNEYEGILSEADESVFLEMCEDVNVIISSLVYEYDMILP